MGEEETASLVTRKELRRQKLMEYLAAKGKRNLPGSKPYVRDNGEVQKPATSALQVCKGKENKASANRLTREDGKIKALDSRAKKSFNDTSKVTLKSGMLTQQQNASHPSATSRPAQSKILQNPGPTAPRSVSCRPSMKAAVLLKQRPNVGVQPSVKVSTNTGHTAGKSSDGRWGARSNASSCQSKTVTVRVNLGPIVKTKTGLIPAVIQPRNTKFTLTHSTAAAGVSSSARSVAGKAQPRVTPSFPVSNSSSMARRKMFPATALDITVHQRAAVSRVAIKSQAPKEPGAKPPFAKHPQQAHKSQLSSGPNSFSSSKCTAAPVKPTGKPAGRPTEWPAKLDGERNGQPRKATSRASLAPASRCSSGVVGKVPQAAVTAQGGKPAVPKQTEIKNCYNPVKAARPQTGAARKSAAVTSRAEPRPAATAGTETPKVPSGAVPHAAGKKLTAAQEERMRKLQEWREAKGISYKRPPMPVKPKVRRTIAVPQSFWPTMKEEDDASSFIWAVDKSLADCIKLLQEGCPPERVKGVLSRLPPVSHKFAKYWICKARLMEQEGDLDVLPMFEEAVRVVLEPVDELRTVVFEILKKKDESQGSDQDDKEEDGTRGSAESLTDGSGGNPRMTTPPRPVRALICGERGDSSVVKYKITATPGGPPSQQREPARVNGQEVRFFTPVRRSVRIERASLRYPASLQDHDLCVASYDDLFAVEEREPGEEQAGGGPPDAGGTPMYVYRQNDALHDKVSVQLVYDEAEAAPPPPSPEAAPPLPLPVCA